MHSLLTCFHEDDCVGCDGVFLGFASNVFKLTQFPVNVVQHRLLNILEHCRTRNLICVEVVAVDCCLVYATSIHSPSCYILHHASFVVFVVH
jgi:hypothetical protein